MTGSEDFVERNILRDKINEMALRICTDNMICDSKVSPTLKSTLKVLEMSYMYGDVAVITSEQMVIDLREELENNPTL